MDDAVQITNTDVKLLCPIQCGRETYSGDIHRNVIAYSESQKAQKKHVDYANKSVQMLCMIKKKYI